MATQTIDFQGVIQLRRGYQDDWQQQNPVLEQGELGIELDTYQLKMGDGATAWNELPYGGIKGDKGATGAKGDKGDIGDVTPAALQALEDAEAARDAAQGFSNSANTKAGEAAASATAADGSKTAAAASASAAATSAGEASDYAEQAQDSATAAAQDAFNAGASATTASQAASTAQQQVNVALLKAQNLADLQSATVARTNLDVYGKSQTYSRSETYSMTEADNRFVSKAEGVTTTASRVVGFTGQTRVANRQYFDMNAQAVILTNAAGLGIVIKNPSALSVTFGSLGVGGRDAGGAATIGQWYYIYYIYNPSTQTLSTICSLIGPATGPTLPTGYTYWAHASTVLLQSDSFFRMVRQDGSKLFYDAPVLAGTTQVTTWTTLNLVDLIPPGSRSCSVSHVMPIANNASGATRQANGLYRVDSATGNETVGISLITPVNLSNYDNCFGDVYVTASRTIDIRSSFLLDNSAGAMQGSYQLYVVAYKVPNGDY